MQYIITYFLSLQCILGSLFSLSRCCCVVFGALLFVFRFIFMLPSVYMGLECCFVCLYVAFCLCGNIVPELEHQGKSNTNSNCSIAAPASIVSWLFGLSEITGSKSKLIFLQDLDKLQSK